MTYHALFIVLFKIDQQKFFQYTLHVFRDFSSKFEDQKIFFSNFNEFLQFYSIKNKKIIFRSLKNFGIFSYDSYHPS
jgi:hypothetical protein